MPPDYYQDQDAGADAADQQPPDDQSQGQGQDEESAEGETALLPKSLFGGDCKPGDKYTVEVVHVYEDELEVKPVKDEDEDQEPSEMGKADSALAAMGGGGGGAAPDEGA